MKEEVLSERKEKEANGEKEQEVEGQSGGGAVVP